MEQWNRSNNDHGEDRDRILSKNLVRFRLCPLSSCSSSSTEGYTSKYGDYVIDLDTFLYYLLPSGNGLIPIVTLKITVKVRAKLMAVLPCTTAWEIAVKTMDTSTPVALPVPVILIPTTMISTLMRPNIRHAPNKNSTISTSDHPTAPRMANPYT